MFLFNRRPNACGVIVALTCLVPLASTWRASAEQVVFTIDPMLSSVSLSADFSGVPLTEQGPGSTTTRYSGTITVDVDNKLAPTSIEFLSAAAAAGDSGSWLPARGGGSGPGVPGIAEPANYGVQADFGLLGIAYATLRDVVIDITKAPQPVTNGMFDGAQTLTAVAGWFEYNVPLAIGGDVGSDPYDGSTDNVTFTPGTYAVTGNTATLTLPLEWITGGSVITVFTGQFVATATLPQALACDFNASGSCNIVDIDALVTNVAGGGGNLQFDLTGDGMVTLADVDRWREVAGNVNIGPGRSYRPGDINLDTVVDGSDFGLWNSNKFTATGKWSQGDLNADGSTDGSDFGIWNSNKFTASDGSLVPEPACVGLIACGLAILAVRRGHTSVPNADRSHA